MATCVLHIAGAGTMDACGLDAAGVGAKARPGCLVYGTAIAACVWGADEAGASAGGGDAAVVACGMDADGVRSKAGPGCLV